MPFQDWDDIEARAEEIMANAVDSFDPATIANVRDLLAASRTICPLPDEMGKGHWSTLSFSWPEFELEVCEDRIEVYHFSSDGKFQIWYEQHTHGQNFSAQFLQELIQPKTNSVSDSSI